MSVGGEYYTRLYPDSNFYFGENPTGQMAIPLTYSVNMGNQDVTMTTTLETPTGPLDINIPVVNGNVVITVKANQPTIEPSFNAPSGSANNVSLNLSHCTASNTSESTGSTYSNVLTPDEGYVFVRSGLLGGVQYGNGNGENDIALTCTITMGEDDVTNSVFDISTGEIGIDEVTGDITVTVAEQNLPTN